MTPRRVYLMTDYASSSLWTDEPSHGMLTLDGLPLDAETKRALEAWSPATDEDAATDQAAHLREGLRLWALVREQLGPDHEVGLATFIAVGSDSQKVIAWRPEDVPPDGLVGC